MLIRNYKIDIFIKTFLLKFSKRDINQFIIFLTKHRLVFTSNSKYSLPDRVKKFSVVRSPTMSKLSKEQFETRQVKSCLTFKLDGYLEYMFLEKIEFVKLVYYSYVQGKFSTILKDGFKNKEY